MARFGKIIAGPARSNDPQAVEGLTATAIKPGSVVFLNAGVLTLHGTAGAGGDTALYIAEEDYIAGGDVDTDISSGETGVGLVIEKDTMYNVLVADTINVDVLDKPLASAGDGTLRIGVVGTDDILFYAKEVFNNTTGSAALVRCRPAMVTA